jgi:CxxC-x17-CxxC domain-containing protein
VKLSLVVFGLGKFIELLFSSDGQLFIRGGFFIMFQDKTLNCKDCGSDFTFTASEQEFYAEKGFTNEPGRCPECRAARKAANRGGRNSYPREERQMYNVTCSACGKETQVPFQPRGDKPVYCRECYRPRNNW